MNRNLIISYYWRRDGKRATVKPDHEEALEERALERITEMMKEGYTSGELNDHVRMSNKDGMDGVPYSGWWSVETKNPEEEPHGIISRSVAPFYYGGWDASKNEPNWVKDPKDAAKIPLAELGALVNKVAERSRGCVNGIVNPTPA